MQKILNKFGIGLAAAVTTMGLSGGAVLAQATTGRSFQANLTALNKSDDRGNSTVILIANGNGTYTVRTTGSSANLPHAQHIHIGGTNTCPDISLDKDKDGFINTAEGQPAYGPVEISLTTSGDTSKDSALAVDRFPVANADGTVTYERSFALPAGISESMLEQGVVVTHGISELFNDKAKYDGDKKSSLDEKLPLEATIPATCGKLVAVPTGGAGAGEGTTTGVENTGAIALGASAVLGAGALLLVRKRSLNANNR